MKIGILGTAAHYAKAPFADTSWEMWACNTGEPVRWDRWFQLHSEAIIDSLGDYREWLRAQTKPIYLQKPLPDVPAGIEYPLAAMREKYGTWFFTSTIAFMLALAIEQQPEEIGLWGVDMAHETEYAYQKPGARFFIQTARMAGIKVTLPPESEIETPSRLYGYDPEPWLYMKSQARLAELRGRQAVNDARRQQIAVEKTAMRGALDIKLPPEAIAARLGDLAVAEAAADRDALLLDGAIQNMNHILINWTGEYR